MSFLALPSSTTTQATTATQTTTTQTTTTQTTKQRIYPLAISAKTAKYIPITGYADYEILNYEPFTVRNAKTKRILTGGKNNEGYALFTFHKNNAQYTEYKHQTYYHLADFKKLRNISQLNDFLLRCYISLHNTHLKQFAYLRKRFTTKHHFHRTFIEDAFCDIILRFLATMRFYEQLHADFVIIENMLPGVLDRSKIIDFIRANRKNINTSLIRPDFDKFKYNRYIDFVEMIKKYCDYQEYGDRDRYYCTSNIIITRDNPKFQKYFDTINEMMRNNGEENVEFEEDADEKYNAMLKDLKAQRKEYLDMLNRVDYDLLDDNMFDADEEYEEELED